MTPEQQMDALEAAARAFVGEVERPSEQPVIAMLGAVSALLAAGARAQPLANEPGPTIEEKDILARVGKLERRSWSPDRGLPDEFRQTMHAVYRDEYGREDDVTKLRVSQEIAELHSYVAPFVRALDGGMDRRQVLRTLAWDVQNAWGETVAGLVRPLWELARW